jgi:hypothetical protein
MAKNYELLIQKILVEKEEAALLEKKLLEENILLENTKKINEERIFEEIKKLESISFQKKNSEINNLEKMILEQNILLENEIKNDNLQANGNKKLSDKVSSKVIELIKEEIEGDNKNQKIIKFERIQDEDGDFYKIKVQKKGKLFNIFDIDFEKEIFFNLESKEYKTINP